MLHALMKKKWRWIEIKHKYNSLLKWIPPLNSFHKKNCYVGQFAATIWICYNLQIQKRRVSAETIPREKWTEYINYIKQNKEIKSWNIHAENQCNMKNLNWVSLCISRINRKSTFIKRSEPKSFAFISKINIEEGLTTFNKNRNRNPL